MSYWYEKDGFVMLPPKRGDNGSTGIRGVAVRLSAGARMPERATTGDGGADLFAYLPELGEGTPMSIEPGQYALVDTGVAVKIPYGYCGFVMPRSSMRARGISSNGDGLIDAGYRGTIKIVIQNHNQNLEYKINHGDKIGQLVIQKVELVEFVDIWNDTERGEGGFGSTNK